MTVVGGRSGARCSSGEDFGEEGFNGAPGTGVAGGVVGDAGDVPLVFVGEAVLGVAVDGELPVGVGGLHFVGEGGDLGERDVRVESAVEDEEFGFDGVGRSGRAFCVEAAVDADDTGDGRAAAGEFENGHAAEAVADGGDVGVGERMRFQGVEASGGAAGDAIGFGAEFVDASHDALAIAGDAFAVHVAGEGGLAEFGQTAGAIFGVVVEAGAAVDDEHAGAFVFD